MTGTIQCHRCCICFCSVQSDSLLQEVADRQSGKHRQRASELRRGHGLEFSLTSSVIWDARHGLKWSGSTPFLAPPVTVATLRPGLADSCYGCVSIVFGLCVTLQTVSNRHRHYARQLGQDSDEHNTRHTRIGFTLLIIEILFTSCSARYLIVIVV